MEDLVWCKNHIIPNLHKVQVKINGKMGYWHEIVLANIDADVKENRKYAQLYILVMDPDSEQLKMVSVTYMPSQDADTIRNMIKASA